MYALISHVLLNADANTPKYTFKYEGSRKVGDLMLCNTKFGRRLGKIVGFVDEADVHFVPTATAVKLNAGRRRSLSAYDRAFLKFLEGNTNSSLEEFNLYNPSERKEFCAFCYGILDATRIDILDNHAFIYIYNYKEDSEDVIDHEFF